MSSNGNKVVTIVYGGRMAGPGGVTSHIRRTMTGLGELGYGARVVSLESLPVMSRYAGHVLQAAGNRVAYPAGFEYRLRLNARRLARCLAAAGPMPVIYEDIYLAAAAPRLGGHSLVVLHALQSDNLNGIPGKARYVDSLKRYEAECLERLSGRLVCVSEMYRASVLTSLSRYLRFEPQIDVIPLGIDTSIMPAPKVKSHGNGPLNIVAAGVLNGRKNFGFFQGVIAEARRRSCRLNLGIIGEGPLRQQLEQQLGALTDAERRVVFHGWVAEQDAWRIMQQYDILMHPSTIESFSFTLLEAKALGLFTIATDTLDVPAAFCNVRAPLDPARWLDAAVNYQGIGAEQLREQALDVRTRYSYVSMARAYLDRMELMRREAC